MARTIALAAFALAAGAILLDWLEYQYISRAYSAEFYLFAIACLFAALGVFLGAKLSKGAGGPAEPTRNAEAISYLGISAREEEVLALLAKGQSNKEMARTLGVSPNTVKTHISKLYEKLQVSNRTEAAAKARDLNLVV